MKAEVAKIHKGNDRQAPPNEIPLDQVISSINNSLSIAQGKLDGVVLNEGSVTLETTYSKEAGGGFKLFVRAERKWSKEAANSVTYKYTKPEEKKLLVDYEDKLALIIVDAANQYKSSTAITGLKKDGFDIELSLSITKATGVGLEFEIFKVGLDVGADFEKTVFHKIILSFGLKK